MTLRRAVLSIGALVLILGCVASAPTLVWAQAGTISKDMQNYCVNDYKKFCGDYGLQTAALESLHEEGGPEPVAGLREGAGGGRKGFASRRG